ncbi:hypothetical protein ACFSKU_00385 [Pontibacter silvestris]|uniref:Uncharacterized protein n=1 Tax=Pontibacter silvestris TaxID=2305183 RepID=A0ABW4WSC2_9BACT|nr:hypothetical protein [Pontibacter silvestris]MCC9138179.1 hypothetical protein [Pontibacter silvestris]
MQIATELLEIYATNAGAVYQCDHRNRVLVHFAGEIAVLKVDAFLRLKHAIDSIDLEAMAANTERSSDFEIVTVCGCERCYVLTLMELYALRELLAGARFSMELNSMLYQCLHLQAA